MRTFITCKRIQAARVIDIQFDPGTCFLVLEDGKSVEVGLDWLHKRVPNNGACVGGYFIRYPDGYTSWSPAAAFEESATPESEWGLSLAQEPKYTISLKGKLINRHTSKPIPDQVPLMIFRADDKMAYPGAVLPYRDLTAVMNAANREGAAERMHAFADHALHHPSNMKDPT